MHKRTEREMEFHHFSHVHPLILAVVSSEKTVDGAEILCEMCRQRISRFAYSCTRCSFFLHKFCAELPVDIQHPLHDLAHPLTLRSLPNRTCDACGKGDGYGGFIYNCFFCDFDIHMKCAVRGQTVEHKNHQHPLSRVLIPALFECHACGIRMEDVSYICNTCGFWIHEGCGSLPTTIRHFCHVHPLTLDYYRNNHVFFREYCSVCHKQVKPNFWVYSCLNCRDFVHVNCSTRPRESKPGIMAENLDDATLIRLPGVHDQKHSLIDQFVKQMSSLGGNKSEAEVSHFSHKHPLTLSNAFGDSSDLSIPGECKNEKICDACVRPISTPIFYSCNPCNDFLHKSCAEFPNELQHPFHPHKLILQLGKCPESGDDFFICRGCYKACNGFAFRCAEPECGNYSLDLQCASLPSTIIHEAHEHPLLLKDHCVEQGCAACDRVDSMFAFGCGTCSFSLHYKCALLPRTISHRYDIHPFTLIYAPIKDGPDEYICDFCERFIDPNWWFYHCIDCDRSACARCIHREEKEYPTIKLGSTCKFQEHPHPVTLIEATLKNPICCRCGEVFFRNERAFECTECNFIFHPRCIGDVSPPNGWVVMNGQ